jgi:hypothetical protein
MLRLLAWLDCRLLSAPSLVNREPAAAAAGGGGGGGALHHRGAWLLRLRAEFGWLAALAGCHPQGRKGWPV